MLLFQHWLRLVDERPLDPAIIEASSGNVWTFEELHNRCLTASSDDSTEIVIAKERGVGFVLATLAAWRLNRPLLPLELGQTAPRLDSVPLGTVHLKLTSGTTGKPRIVLFRAEQLIADVEQIIATMGIHPASPNLGAISLAHSYGFSNLVLPLLIHGVPLILAENPLPDTLRRILEQHTHLTLPAVPAMWRAWHQAGVLGPGIRLAISAGAPLNTDLEKAVFETSHVKIHNFYGSSECGGIAYDRQESPRECDEQTGTPLNGVTLECDKQGVLVVKSAAVGEGYLHSKQNDCLGRGIFRTQDIGRVDPSGKLYLCGRLGESINVAGRKLSPVGIETELLKCKGVRHALVFGIPSRNSERLEEIVAVLHLSCEQRLETVRTELAERLPQWEQPRHWWLCPELQPDARGKLSRESWRARYLLHVQGASCN